MTLKLLIGGRDFTGWAMANALLAFCIILAFAWTPWGTALIVLTAITLGVIACWPRKVEAGNP